MHQKGVNRLAQSRFSSNTVDSKDVAFSLVAFEAINSCRIEFRMSTVDRGGRADVQLTILAHPLGVAIGEAPSLGSVSQSFLGMRLTSLDAAVFQLLYALDFQLAEREFDRGGKQET